MKKLLLIGFVLIGLSAMGQYQEIKNLETGLSVRTKMNTMFEQLYSNISTLQFSADGTSWHDTYAGTDNYFRVSEDVGVTWGTAIPLTSGFKVQFSANDTIYSDSYTAGDAYYRFSTDGGTVWTDGIAMDASGFVLKSDSITGYVTHEQLTDSLDAIAAGNDNQVIDTLQLSSNALQLSLERDAVPVKTLDLSQFMNADSVWVERDSVFSFETLYYTKGESTYSITTISKKDGIEEGGLVSWIDSLNFAVTPAFYRIGGTDYESGNETVTLDAADATNSRIDVIALDTLGGAVVIKGTAAANPVKPQINPQAHVELTQVLILANATEPSTVGGDSITATVVYDENTEWTASASGMLADFASTAAVYSGTYAAEVTTVGNDDYIKFVDGVNTPSINDYKLLSFWIKLKEALPKGHYLYVSLYLSDTPSTNEIQVNADASSTEWQNVTVLFSEFAQNQSLFNEVRFRWGKSGANTTFTGFYIDYVTLQTGIQLPSENYLTQVDTTANHIVDANWKAYIANHSGSGSTGVTSVNGATGVVTLDTDDVSEGTTNKYNATHTGEVTGATSLTIADNVVDYANVDETLKSAITDNDGTWDYSAAGVINASISTNTTVSFTNLQLNKQLKIKLTLSSSATITWPAYVTVTSGSATLADGTFYIYADCWNAGSGTEDVLISIVQ